MYFKDLGLDDQLLDAISYMGFEEATEVQALSMPAILEGKDITTPTWAVLWYGVHSGF